MDGVSAVASVIALVQAGGMLLQVGKAFHETFISKDNDHRAEDAALRVASIGEFIQKIELFQAVKLITAPSTQPALGASTTLQPGLDHTLEQCREQLRRLQEKTQKMLVPKDASKLKRFVTAVRLKLNEAEFAQIEAANTLMLQQLTLFMALAQFQLSQQGHAHSQEQHNELLQKHLLIEMHIQNASQQSMDQQATLLADLQRNMDDHQMRLDAQVAAFEQSHQIILSSFEKLTISPRLDRSTSGLSGTTAATDTEPTDDEDLLTPIAPALMRHPGFGFREDRLSEPKVARAVLDRVEEWLTPKTQDLPLLCIQTANDADAIHDLCNRMVQDIAGSGERVLCYNGLPRNGPPPAPGWYTMTHAIWWLAGQLLIPVPHKDGHMPSHGYVPNIELMIERLQKQTGMTYIVLYLLTRSCPAELDRRLYELLVERLVEASRTSSIRLVVFSDEANDAAVARLPNGTVVTVLRPGDEVVALDDWDSGIADGTTGDESEDDETSDDHMSVDSS